MLDAEAEALTHELAEVRSGDIRVVGAAVEAREGSEDFVLLHVSLTAPQSGSEWSADDFYEIRKRVRELASARLRGNEFRVTYSDEGSNAAADPPPQGLKAAPGLVKDE